MKRELEKKLEPLVKRTNQSISHIIRNLTLNYQLITGNRLKSEKNISDFGASDHMYGNGLSIDS